MAPNPSTKEPLTIASFVRGAMMQNLGLKFVAFVLALTVFILVHSDEHAVAGAYVNIIYQLPEERVVVSERYDQVRITVRGSWRRVKRFDESSLGPIRIDLRSTKSGDFVFKADMFRLPPGLKVQSIDPPTMSLRFEPLASKTVPIIAATRGAPARGFGVAALQATRIGCTAKDGSCGEITIEGAESEVLRIKEIRTEEVSVENRTGSFEHKVQLVPPSANVRVPTMPSVRVAVTVVEELTVRDLGQVPIEVRATPGIDVGLFATAPVAVSVVLRGGRLAVERVLPSQVQAFVQAYPGDLSIGRKRPTPVQFDGVPDGVAVELEPRAVTLQRRTP